VQVAYIPKVDGARSGVWRFRLGEEKIAKLPCCAHVFCPAGFDRLTFLFSASGCRRVVRAAARAPLVECRCFCMRANDCLSWLAFRGWEGGVGAEDLDRTGGGIEHAGRPCAIWPYEGVLDDDVLSREARWGPGAPATGRLGRPLASSWSRSCLRAQRHAQRRFDLLAAMLEALPSGAAFFFHPNFRLCGLFFFLAVFLFWAGGGRRRDAGSVMICMGERSAAR
jgi:hypothetical protein